MQTSALKGTNEKGKCLPHDEFKYTTFYNLINILTVHISLILRVIER